MATQSSVLAWKIPWSEEPGWATVHVVAKSQTEGLTCYAFISLEQISRSRMTSTHGRCTFHF